ncbi:hypothetical protein K1T71_008787 [Dendrolimus kikuchii]|uniref:Uncharacterized protein n=1 Tax=Dendrolimus kikuchii TaxID=765133 RepID=A0ACC1CVG0_9NEOP|nr:hypothetical protein K1T71_008787 [Dendrolimus kikuchii]
MDSSVSSDDSCDSETKRMKSQLTEYGLGEEHLTKEEMSDILVAINNSKTSIKEENARLLVDADGCTGKPLMKRRYLNVRDRRLPWSLLPVTITQTEKARALAVYVKLMSINNYRQARQLTNFASWPPPIQIVEEATRIQPLRSTRSGRSVPIYTGYDDDSPDIDFVITKTKRRKINDQSAGDGVYSNKVVSLKRKTQRDENSRPIKEIKMNCENDASANIINIKTSKEAYSFVED